jgi:hypothetical protein
MSTVDDIVDQRTCEECGAVLTDGITCRERFDELLALDHSRTEPWGSRHGLAFAVFTLQHAPSASHEMVERCRDMLQRVYVNGEERHQVYTTLRASHARPLASSPCQMPPIAPHGFAFTIADMGDFAADTYVANLDAWCRATLDAWSR